MSKVTYEEESINIWGHKFTKEEFDNLVAGLKPPTFDEVVKAWKKSYGEHVVLTERGGTIKVEGGVSTSYFSSDDIDAHVRFFGSKGHIILNAIHLTIRYLQAKEK